MRCCPDADPSVRGRGARGFKDAIGSAPTTSLTLPAFGSGSAVQIANTAFDRQVGAVGKALVARGVTLERRGSEPIARVVERGMKAWLDSQWGQLKHVGVRCVIRGSLQSALEVDEGEYDGAEDEIADAAATTWGVDTTKPHVALAFEASERGEVLVGRSAERLNSIVPGLGTDAVRTSSGVVSALVGGMDLDDVLDMAKEVYWHGMEDESEFVREVLDGEDSYEGISRAELDARVPASLVREGRGVSRASLQKAAADSDGLVREVAQVLAALKRIGRPRPGCGIFPVSSDLNELMDWAYITPEIPILIGWKDHEIAHQVWDAFFENAWNSGEFRPRPFIGVELIDLEAVDPLLAMELRWKKPLKALQLADRLMGLLDSREEAA